MDTKPAEKPAEKSKQVSQKSSATPKVTNNSGYAIDFAGVVIGNGETAELVLDRQKPFVKALLDAKAISVE